MAEIPGNSQIVWLAHQVMDLRLSRLPIVRAELAIALAPMTVMIEKGIITAEEAVQRIEQIHDGLQPEKEHPHATVLLQTAAVILRESSPRSGQRWTPVVIQGGLSGLEDPPEDS